MPNTVDGFNLDKYKSYFKGGARQNLFYFIPHFPPNITTVVPDLESVYMVRTTSLPNVSLEAITLNWQGFDYKIPGKATYGDLAVTFNVDKDNKIRNKFEKWAKLIINPQTNKREINPSNYMQDQEIQLLDGNGDAVVIYRLIDAWPMEVGTATLDHASNDILQFDVTFAYQYFVNSEV